MILPPYQRGDLKDHRWKRLQPLLPSPKPDLGGPYTDYLLVINGILWILRKGAPWRDLPEYWSLANCFRTLLRDVSTA